MALGRGLGAILDDIEESYVKDISKNSEIVREIEISKIVPNPFQPRKVFDKKSLQELSNSIKQQGLIQPIIVVEEDNEFILIAGERRLRAHKLLNRTKIKALIIDFDMSKLREFAIIENLQREELNVLDLANSLYELIEEHSYTHEEIAKLLSKSRSYITNILRLLKLSEYSKSKLLTNEITFGHAKSLVNLDETIQNKMIDMIIEKKLSAREVEKLVKVYKTKNNDTSSSKKIIDTENKFNLDEIVLKMVDKYGLNISKSNNSIVINVTSKKDLKKIKKIFDI